MRTQFDHNLISSFYLWFDNRLCVTEQAYITGTQNFIYAQGIDTPSNYYSYYSSERQFCADNDNAPNYFYISGQQIYQDTTGTNKKIIDHNQGRILLNKNEYGTGVNISGQFVQKEVNLYITNETEEEILLNREFYLESGQSYLESVNEMAKARYCAPCVFLTNNFSKNKGFSLGGLRDTSNYIRAVVFASSNYQLDGILASFRDASESCFRLIDYTDFPYGQFWHVKNFPYSYTGLIEGNNEKIFIKSSESYKLKDSAQSSLNKIRKDLFLGYIDFEISTIRSVS